MKTTMFIPFTFFITSLLGCNIENEGNNSNTKTEETKNHVSFTHSLSATHSKVLSFDNAPFDIPGSAPSLVSDATGPFDLSGTNMLHFDIQLTTSDNASYNYPAIFDSSTGAIPSSTTISEIKASLEALLPVNISFTESPLTMTVTGPYANGSTITLTPFIENGITLTQLGFNDSNRTNTGIADSSTADYLYTGIMEAVSDTTGLITYTDWSIYLDQEGNQVISNNNMSLIADSYTFTLNVYKDDLNYIGTTQSTITEGDNSLIMNLSPVINLNNNTSTVMDHTLISTLTRYEINFGNALPHYDLGITVNNEAEQIINIASTNLSGAFYLNLSPGPQQISLNLYDGINLIGSSLAAQENQNIIAGRSIAMDIAPILGITEFLLSESGGDAQVSLNIPPQVTDEVGDASNLAGSIVITGDNNNAVESLNINGNIADATITGVNYGEAILTINYVEIDSGDIVATCSTNITLNQNPAFSCDLRIRQPAFLEGQLISYLGLNVVDINGEPINGAVITDMSQNVVGITGNHAFGTPGYTNIILTADNPTYTITSADGLLTASTSVAFAPLSVINRTVTLL